MVHRTRASLRTGKISSTGPIPTCRKSIVTFRG